MTDPPVCPYCGRESHLVTGRKIYPRLPALHLDWLYQCEPCDAYVGCHPGTQKPLGRLADHTLRQAKIQAHRAFDQLWKSGKMKRNRAYFWLSQELGIPADQCHIGMFDVETCKAVVTVCKAFSRGLPLPADTLARNGLSGWSRGKKV